MGRSRMRVRELVVDRLNQNWFKVVNIAIDATANNNTSAADPELVGGVILGWHANLNQDQHIKSISLGSNGSVNITLLNAATANSTWRVVVAKKPTIGTT